jgi:hypothetical protein
MDWDRRLDFICIYSRGFWSMIFISAKLQVTAQIRYRQSNYENATLTNHDVPNHPHGRSTILFRQRRR